MQKFLKFVNNESFIRIISFIIISVIFIFLGYCYRYFYIQNDDIFEYIAYDYIAHGRFLKFAILKVIVVFLPLLFKIPIQNFAVMSALIVFPTVISVLIIQLSLVSFYELKKNLLFPLVIILNFFMLFAFLFQTDYITNFSTTYTSLFSYFAPLILFIIFWLKVLNSYIYEKSENIKGICFITLLSGILMQCNELLAFGTILLQFILFFDYLISRRKIPVYLISSILFSVLVSLFVLFSSGFQDKLTAVYSASIPDIKSVIGFLYVFYNKLILDNIFLISFFLLLLGFIKTLSIDSALKNKIFKYSIYTCISFLSFYLSLYFIGEGFDYYSSPDYNTFPRYWILHSGLLFGFKVILYLQVLYLLGFIRKYSDNILLRNSLIIIYFAISLLFVTKFYHHLNLSNYECRKVIYIADKLSKFYFSKNMVAVLPREDAGCILPTVNNLMPDDLESDNPDDWIGKVYHNDKYSYLIYLENVYKIDSSPGMTFKTYNEAIQDYKNSGGILTDEELEKTDFSKI